MESEKQLGIFILVSFMAFLTPAAIIVALFTVNRKKALEKEAKIKEIEHEKQIENYKLVGEAEEREREKIAKNLHDGIIPGFCSIQSNLEYNTELIADEKLAERFNKDIDTLIKSINQLRGITHDLAPPVLVKYGLISAIEEYVEYAGLNIGEVSFENNSNFKNKFPFSIAEQNNIYRIFLELMQNLSKYAAYEFLQIRVANTETDLIISLVHNGKGISQMDINHIVQSDKGLGLKSIFSRAKILNADIKYDFKDGLAWNELIVPFQLINIVEHSIKPHEKGA